MVYVTSDLHGCSPETLCALLAKAGFGDEDFLYILGDVIDRGDHGAELLLWLTQQPNVQLLLGNHESMMLACSFLFEAVTEKSLNELTVENLELVNTWISNGGGPTLNGLRRILKTAPELMEGIMDYLLDAPVYDETTIGGRHFVLVHAGIADFAPEKPLDAYAPDAFLWDRPELTDRYFSDATVIFGHTPTEYYGPQYADRAVKTDSWLCIDTGAARGGKPMLLRLDDLKEFYI